MMFALASCTQRGCQSASREFQYSERNYKVHLYSGGKEVFTDSFTGIINQEDHSDGLYYFRGDKLIEISGEYIIESSR